MRRLAGRSVSGLGFGGYRISSAVREHRAALIAALDNVLSDPASLTRWQAACRPRAEDGFRIDDEAQSLIAIYRKLLSSSTD